MILQSILHSYSDNFYHSSEAVHSKHVHAQLIHTLPQHTHTLGLPGSTGGGVVYTRWGRTNPSTSGTQLLYMLEGQLEVFIL